MDVLIQILNIIGKLGYGIEASSLLQDSSSSSAYVPMDIDWEQKKIISMDEDESLRETYELGIDNSAKNLS